jgi:hypothetical protein
LPDRVPGPPSVTHLSKRRTEILAFGFPHYSIGSPAASVYVVHDACQLDSIRANAPATDLSAPRHGLSRGQPTRLLATPERRFDRRRGARGTRPGAGRHTDAHAHFISVCNADSDAVTCADVATDYPDPDGQSDATRLTHRPTADGDRHSHTRPNGDSDSGSVGTSPAPTDAVERPRRQCRAIRRRAGVGLFPDCPPADGSATVRVVGANEELRLG